MPPATPTSMDKGLGTLFLGAGVVVALEDARLELEHGDGGDLLAVHLRLKADAFGQLARALSGQHDALVFVVSALVLFGQFHGAYLSWGFNEPDRAGRRGTLVPAPRRFRRARR